MRIWLFALACVASPRASAPPRADPITVDAAPAAAKPPPPDPAPLQAAAMTANTPAAWEAAALAYDAVATYDATPPAARRDAMESAVHAWKQSFSVTSESSHVADAAASFRRYADALGAADPQYVELVYDAGNLFWQAQDLDDAVPALAIVVRQFPSNDRALFAAQMLLDALNRAERYDELRAWVDEMRKTPALLAHGGDLGQILSNLRGQFLRKDAENAEQAGDHTTCAREYMAIHADAPTASDDDEILYDALVCFRAAHDDHGAAGALDELEHEHPSSQLAARARDLP